MIDIYSRGGKVESCSRVKDGNGRLVLDEAEVRRIWKEYYKDLYNIDYYYYLGSILQRII